jgi:hypothetical protein
MRRGAAIARAERGRRGMARRALATIENILRSAYHIPDDLRCLFRSTPGGKFRCAAGSTLGVRQPPRQRFLASYTRVISPSICRPSVPADRAYERRRPCVSGLVSLARRGSVEWEDEETWFRHFFASLERHALRRTNGQLVAPVA